MTPEGEGERDSRDREPGAGGPWSVAGVYLLSASLTLLVLEVMAQTAGLPPWFPYLALGVFLVGLPFVVTVAFLRTHSPPPAPAEKAVPERGSSPRHPLQLSRPLLLLLLLAVGVGSGVWLGLRLGPKEEREPPIPTFEPLLLHPHAGQGGPGGDGEVGRALRLSLHRDLLLRLAGVEGLALLTSPTDVDPGAHPSPARGSSEAHALAVHLEETDNGFLLEARLTDARGRDRWEEEWRGNWEGRELLEAQGGLALLVVETLRGSVHPEEDRRLQSRTQVSLEALQALGHALEVRPALEREGHLRRAVDADPSFAMAWSELALHLARGDGAGREGNGRTDGVQESADRALRLDPWDGVARLALGILYEKSARSDGWGYRHRAAREYERSARRLPGLPDAYPGWVEAARRSGTWKEAEEAGRRWAGVEPGARSYLELGRTLHLLRRYAEAEPHLEASIQANPTATEPYHLLFLARLSRTGELERAREVLERHPEPARISEARFLAHLWAREYGAAGEVARDELPSRLVGPCIEMPRSTALGEVLAFAGQLEGTRRTLEAAASEVEGWLEENPGDPRILSSLARIRALAGERQEAVRLAEAAVEHRPVGMDAVEGAGCLATLARAHLLSGQARAAVDLLEWTLSLPGPLTPGELRLDPIWDPLRGDRRFDLLMDLRMTPDDH